MIQVDTANSISHGQFSEQRRQCHAKEIMELYGQKDDDVSKCVCGIVSEFARLLEEGGGHVAHPKFSRLLAQLEIRQGFTVGTFDAAMAALVEGARQSASSHDEVSGLAQKTK